MLETNNFAAIHTRTQGWHEECTTGVCPGDFGAVIRGWGGNRHSSEPHGRITGMG